MTREKDKPGDAPPTSHEATPEHDFEQENVRSIPKARRKIPRTHEVDCSQGGAASHSRALAGRFDGDGWSRSRSATSTYVVTSILMLAILSLVYLVLVPEFRLTP